MLMLIIGSRLKNLWNAFNRALNDNNLEIAKLLLVAGANINVMDFNYSLDEQFDKPIFKACEKVI